MNINLFKEPYYFAYEAFHLSRSQINEGSYAKGFKTGAIAFALAIPLINVIALAIFKNFNILPLSIKTMTPPAISPPKPVPVPLCVGGIKLSDSESSPKPAPEPLSAKEIKLPDEPKLSITAVPSQPTIKLNPKWDALKKRMQYTVAPRDMDLIYLDYITFLNEEKGVKSIYLPPPLFTMYLISKNCAEIELIRDAAIQHTTVANCILNDPKLLKLFTGYHEYLADIGTQRLHFALELMTNPKLSYMELHPNAQFDLFQSAIHCLIEQMDTVNCLEERINQLCLLASRYPLGGSPDFVKLFDDLEAKIELPKSKALVQLLMGSLYLKQMRKETYPEEKDRLEKVIELFIEGKGKIEEHPYFKIWEEIDSLEGEGEEKFIAMLEEFPKDHPFYIDAQLDIANIYQYVLDDKEKAAKAYKNCLLAAYKRAIHPYREVAGTGGGAFGIPGSI